MSYFEGYDKELADKEREEAEMIASNEYQKELDEGLPHIEKLTDGSWKGTITTDFTANTTSLKRQLFEEIEKQRKKVGDTSSNYIVELGVISNDEKRIVTVFIKLTKDKQDE